MNDRIIPNSDAELLLHRFVTERVPLLVWFVSADGSVRVKITGFLVSSTAGNGLMISPVWPTANSVDATYMVCKGATGSFCEYQGEAEVPEGFVFKSGLRINMPNGDTLTMAEIREKKE